MCAVEAYLEESGVLFLPRKSQWGLRGMPVAKYWHGGLFLRVDIKTSERVKFHLLFWEQGKKALIWNMFLLRCNFFFFFFNLNFGRIKLLVIVCLRTMLSSPSVRRYYMIFNKNQVFQLSPKKAHFNKNAIVIKNHFHTVGCSVHPSAWMEVLCERFPDIYTYIPAQKRRERERETVRERRCKGERKRESGESHKITIS